MSDAVETTERRLVRRETLLDRLLARAWEFDFYQAVWLLERLYAGDAEPVGRRGPVEKEGLRFRPDVMLGFPPTDVRRITDHKDDYGEHAFYRVDVTFLGLYGVATPLPLHYAVDILRSVDRAEVESVSSRRTSAPDAPETTPGDVELAGGSPTRDFLDILHHRLLSLFYCAGLKYRYDLAFGIPGRDEVSTYLHWLIGCPRSFTRDVLGVPPLRLLRYAGILTQHPRSALTLEGMLTDYWRDIAFEVQQYVGRWVPLSPADQNRTGMMNSSLGVDLTVGEMVYDLCGAFRILVGPLNWETYLTFLPDAPRYQQTRALTQLYCMDPFAFNLEVQLLPREVPETQLTSDDFAGRLGYTSWVRTEDVGATTVTFDASLPLPSAAPFETMFADAASGDDRDSSVPDRNPKEPQHAAAEL